MFLNEQGATNLICTFNLDYNVEKLKNNKMHLKQVVAIVFFLCLSFLLKSQEVYQHVSNKNIYDYVDELANQKIIELNSVVLPYSRKLIADKLEEAALIPEQLNKRQIKELEFYKLEYKLEIDSFPDYRKMNFFKKKKNLSTSINPLGLFYKDKLFTFSVKPIWGINYFFNENSNIYHRWGGIEAFAYIGKHWGLYASLRDNNETENISGPEYFTLREG